MAAHPHTPLLLPLPSSLVILTVQEEPLPCPAGSLAIGSMVALRLHSLQPFSTQDTRGQPFLVHAQEAVEVLLRHPSGGAGQVSGLTLTCGPQVPSVPGDPSPELLVLYTGWWLVANEDQQVAWFPAPYLEEVAQGQGQDGGQPLESSGMRLTLLPMPTTTTEQCAAGVQEAPDPGEGCCRSTRWWQSPNMLGPHSRWGPQWVLVVPGISRDPERAQRWGFSESTSWRD